MTSLEMIAGKGSVSSISGVSDRVLVLRRDVHSPSSAAPHHHQLKLGSKHAAVHRRKII